ncbi:signal recognition particle protein Srp54 [Candidatus Woesearchaeota archaeon]|nr:signal recognition particle protein Srp54 [Candidatus Woesearchaeota archaeon]
MVLDKLGNSLRDTLSKVARAVFVDEKLINELVKDIQRALLQADVNVQLVFNLSNTIKDKIKKEETPPGLTKKEFLIKIVYDELTKFLGEKAYEIDTTKKPTKILLVGLFGNGKTTTAAKLAKFYQKRGFKVALLSTDTWRPAAYEQLKQLGSQINAPVYGDPKDKDPINIYKKFEPELNKADIIFIDSAGRDALNEELIKEIEDLSKAVKADERLLVISADLGQAAQSQAQQFHDSVNITGVIATRMDGTAKAGGALSACAVTKSPIKFLGVGEKIDDLEQFNPKRFVGRLLGMGDIESLLEKAKEAIPEEKAEDLGKRFVKGKFDLVDLYDQMKAMKKMGSLGKLVEMIPGFAQLKLPKETLQVQEGKLEIWKHIMDSCTKEELEDPDKISPSRVERIAKGSGTSTKEVRELLKQYKQSKKMAKMLSGGSMKQMEKMMKKVGKGGMPQMKFK